MMLPKKPLFIYTAIGVVTLLSFISILLMIFTSPDSSQNRIIFVSIWSLIYTISVPTIATWQVTGKNYRIKPNEFFRRGLVRNIKFGIMFSFFTLLKIFGVINAMFWAFSLILIFVLTFYYEWKDYHRHRRFF